MRVYSFRRKRLAHRVMNVTVMRETAYTLFAFTRWRSLPLLNRTARVRRRPRIRVLCAVRFGRLVTSRRGA